MRTRSSPAKSSCFAIPPEAERATEKRVRQGSWRPVLADVDRWAAAAQAQNLPLDPQALEKIGLAGLSRKGMKIPLGILERHLLPDVPASWLKSAAANAQGEVLAELVRRANPVSLRAAMGHSLGAPRDRDALGWAIHHNLQEALDAFIAHGCTAPNAMVQVLTVPNEEAASALIPRLVALGASPTAFPAGFSTYRLRPRFSSGSPDTPVEAALVLRLPSLALALIDAGADPSAPARTYSSRSDSDTTALHLGVEALLGDTTAPANRYPDRPGEKPDARRARVTQTHHAAVVALLSRVAGLPAWWVKDAKGRRPAEAIARTLAPQAMAWLKLAEDSAHMVDLPESAAIRPRLRL